MHDLVSEIKRTDANSDAPIMMITANDGFINQSERYLTENAGQSLKKYILLKKGELAYNHGASKIRPYGSCFALKTEEEARIPFVYHCFSTCNCNPDFLSIVLNGKSTERQLRRIVSSGARMDGLLNISYDDYTSIPIMIPSLDEQDRIAECFDALDDTITLHQCKHYRPLTWDIGSTFELFLSHNTATWEQRKLGDIVDRVTRKNANNVSELPLTISAQYGLIDQMEFFGKRIASRDISGYYLLYQGEFAYNKSTSGDAPWGAVKRLDRYENGAVSTLYITFAIKDSDQTDSDFLACYYETDLWHKGVQAVAAEGARNHGLLNIATADFFNTTLMMPSNIEEQKAIGSVLNKVDNLIALHQCKHYRPLNGDLSRKLDPFPTHNTATWEQRKLETVVNSVDTGKSKFDKDGSSGDYAILGSTSVIGYDNEYDYEGDFILTARVGANAGSLYRHAGKVKISDNTVFIQASENIEFLYHLLAQFDVKKLSFGTGQPLVKASELKNLELIMPTDTKEQIKIGECFKSLDNLITLHQRNNLQHFYNHFWFI